MTGRTFSQNPCSKEEGTTIHDCHYRNYCSNCCPCSMFHCHYCSNCCPCSTFHCNYCSNCCPCSTVIIAVIVVLVPSIVVITVATVVVSRYCSRFAERWGQLWSNKASLLCVECTPWQRGRRSSGNIAWVSWPLSSRFLPLFSLSKCCADGR